MTSDEDFERIKLCAARYIWPKREELTPGAKIPWHQWFERKFGENYFDYVARKRAERRNREEDSHE